jgi:hypothetical protein
MAIDSIYDRSSRVSRGETVDFSHGDPIDVFSRLTLYVEFDTDRSDRQPVTRTVPGHPGKWICVYSSLERLLANARDDEVEYSQLSGAHLLTALHGDTGIWFDHTFPEGRQILLPPLEFSTDND